MEASSPSLDDHVVVSGDVDHPAAPAGTAAAGMAVGQEARGARYAGVVGKGCVKETREGELLGTSQGGQSRALARVRRVLEHQVGGEGEEGLGVLQDRKLIRGWDEINLVFVRT